ncbi:long-chain-fatty-acid--CoA ligase [Mycobacterium sp. 050134]|uniref:long-chain-fatty-acid--CoA ligase n=1 Tax=Mycobacterium sp. 050134 TaxID=3096111 RepID=UPI002ED93E78
MLTRQISATATSSPRGLTGGTVASPIRLSWGEVQERATRMATGLAHQGVKPHGSVAVLAGDAADVAALAQATWFLRAALTMLQQPTPRAHPAVWLADTVRAIRLIEADVVVVGDAFLVALDQLAGQGVQVCTVDSLRSAAPAALDADDAHNGDIALRQLTSGSTGVPKAVEISHANLAANAVALFEGMDVDPGTDVIVSWLPLSHDMGMVGFVCAPMQMGVETVVVPPQEFLARPIVWAELIHRHRATITSGPSFGYGVLTRALRRVEQPGPIDLSSLRVAIVGAEPVDHRQLTEFAAAGARFGLRPAASVPAYGLAEATLVVSLAVSRDRPVVDTISRREASDNQRALPLADETDDAQHVVCLGPPVPGTDVRITRAGIALGPREIGAIEIRGPSVAASYLTSDGVTRLASTDGWFGTGDLGYLDERGRIYVCGRAKELIVVAGKNLYPHDIERAAEEVAGVRTGCVIALRIDDEVAGEGFAVLAEVRDVDDEATRVRISRDITAQVSRHVGHLPRQVRLFPAGALPKTSSGKLRRTSARELLLR